MLSSNSSQNQVSLHFSLCSFLYHLSPVASTRGEIYAERNQFSDCKPLSSLGRRLGLEPKGTKTPPDYWQRGIWRWTASASFNVLHQIRINILTSVSAKASLCVLIRCDGGRLQRDQSGGEVYQKWCHSTGVCCWSLRHDVRAFNRPFSSQLFFLCSYWILHSYPWPLFVQATETQQPGAVVRGDCGGEGQSLHRYRVHGQGQ